MSEKAKSGTPKTAAEAPPPTPGASAEAPPTAALEADGKVLAVRTSSSTRRFMLPNAMSKLTPELIEGWGLDYAGFCTRERRSKSPFGPDRDFGCVPSHVRIAAAVLCHRFGLDPWLRHLGPIGFGSEHRPRITRDGLLHILHRGTPENGYRSALDGITWEPGQPAIDTKAGGEHEGGEIQWVISLWLKGLRKPVMGRGTAPVRVFRSPGKDSQGAKLPKAWVPNPHGPALAYKQAVYSALLHATDMHAFALPDGLDELMRACLEHSHESAGGLVLEGGQLVDPSTGEVLSSTGAAAAPSEDEAERAAIAAEAEAGDAGRPDDELPF